MRSRSLIRLDECLRGRGITHLGSQAVTIRQIEPGDKPRVRAFYDELSDRSRRLRYLVPTNTLSDEDLAYFTEVDHKRHEAMVAVDGDRVVGVARYVRSPSHP